MKRLTKRMWRFITHTWDWANGRVWFYAHWTYQPRWWQFLAPHRGTDEYGRRTLVLPVLVGYVVIAYRLCYCPDCTDIRLQTLGFELNQWLTEQVLFDIEAEDKDCR